MPESVEAPVYSLKGVSVSLEVYQDKICIVHQALMGRLFPTFKLGFLDKKGGKTFPMQAITSIDFNKAGSFTAGFLQFSIGEHDNKENKFTFVGSHNNEVVEEIKTYIEQRLIQSRTAAPAPSPAGSIAGELAKLGELLQGGLLSQDEFAAAKKKLLGL